MTSNTPQNAGLDITGGGLVVRTRVGSPPSLLVTLLGDYWWARTEPLPSVALVELLEDFGVSTVAARAALSRLVKYGLLVASKRGRNTYYRLTPATFPWMLEGADRIFRFGEVAKPWSGEWQLIAFSIPESDRTLREGLRSRLRGLGYAPLYDGLWVSTRPVQEQTTSLMRAMGVQSFTAFTAKTLPHAKSTIEPQTAWGLDALAEEYRAFVNDTASLECRAQAGELDPVSALIERTHLMDRWRSFPDRDPELPAELLPAGWPRQRARELFLETYELLGSPAAARVAEIIARHAPELAEHVTPHGVLIMRTS